MSVHAGTHRRTTRVHTTSRRARSVALLRACHLAPTLAVTSIATALAVSTGRGWGSAAVAAAVVSGQLAVGWSNDYLDRERDRDAGRVDKPIAQGQVRATTVRNAAVLAAAACVPLSMLSGLRAAAVHLLAVAVALAYNARLKQTWASPLPFAAAFAALPAFVTLGAPGHPGPPWWALVAAGTFGCGAHFINTLDDLETDLRQGVRGLPQRIGLRSSLLVGASLLAAATATLALGPPGTPDAIGLVTFAATVALVAGVARAARAFDLERCWQLTVLAALAVTVQLLASGSSLT